MIKKNNLFIKKILFNQFYKAIMFFVCFIGFSFFVFASEIEKELGSFKKIKFDIKINNSCADAFKLKDGRIFFPGTDESLIYNPDNNSFSKAASFKGAYQYLIDEGFVLDNGNVLFIGPYLTEPAEKFRSEIYSLVKEDIKEEEMKKYRKRIGMSDEQYNTKLIFKASNFWHSLTKEEQKAIWYPRIQKDPVLFKKYQKYVEDYENSMHAQIYNPITNEFAYTDKVNIRRTRAQKVELNNKKIFIIGGLVAPPGDDFYIRANQIELFDPNKNHFELINTGNQFRYIDSNIEIGHIPFITLLDNNRIFIKFGEKIFDDKLPQFGGYYTFYNLDNNTFSEIKRLNLAYGEFLKLKNGNILLFAPGYSYSDRHNKHISRKILSSIYIFNPYTEELTYICELAKLRGEGGFGAVELGDNRILIFGGKNNKTKNTAEIIDLKAKKSEYIGNTQYKHCNHDGILLDNGNVLIFGDSSTLEMYIQSNK